MQKIKVLLISPYSAQKVGGIGTWTKNLIDYIGANQESIDLKFQNTAFVIKGNIDKGRFNRLFLGVIDSLRIILYTFYNLIVFRPDVVHYTSSASFALFKDYIIVSVCALFRTKFVLHFRFGRIPELSQADNWEWKWIKRVSKLADAVIVIDNGSYQSMKVLDCSDKVFYIPNPVSTEVFESAKSRNGFQRDRMEGKVVFAGHVVPTKGVFELVQACSELAEVSQLVMCGPYLEKIKEELIRIASVREEGQWLVFRGEIKREEVIEELKSSFIFCLPSYTEGFPNAVMEAMAMSCAVVSTGVGAIPEMLEFDTDRAGGLMVKLKDAGSINATLKRLIDDKELAIRLGANGNKKILEEYNLDAIYPQYNTIWSL
ncbi:glycosyltransferase family 4 protein [Bacteroides sp.]